MRNKAIYNINQTNGTKIIKYNLQNEGKLCCQD